MAALGRTSSLATRACSRRAALGGHRRLRRALLLAPSRAAPTRDRTRPGSTTRQAYDLLAQGFGPGFNGPLAIVGAIHDARRRGDDGEPRRVAQGQARRGRGRTAVTNPAGTVGIINVIPTTSPQDARTANLITTIRNTYIPAATDDVAHDDLRRRASRRSSTTSRPCSRASSRSSSGSSSSGLPVADGRLSQRPRSARRGRDEPARGGGVLRPRRRGLPVGLGQLAARCGHRAGRVLPADHHDRDPLRPLDGLPGLPGLAHARGVAQHRATTRRPSSAARPTPVGSSRPPRS